MLIVLSTPLAARAQEPARLVLGNVVSIHAGDGSDEKERGYGLITGRQGNVIWVATAAHVVFKPGWQDQDQPTPHQRISGEWIASSGPRKLARGPIIGANSDIAYLGFDAPVGIVADAWAQKILNPVPVVGERLMIAATLTGIDIDKARAPLPPASRVTEGKTFVVPGLAGLPGQSGAPVTSDRGVVGLFNAHSGDNVGFVIPIETVRNARAAEVAWQLGNLADPDLTPVSFCIRLSGPQRPPFHLGGASSGALDSRGCGRGPAIQQPIILDEPSRFECTPDTIFPSRTLERPIEISCDVKLDGIWDAATAGTLRITRYGATRWKFQGLESSSLGRIAGEINGQPSDALVDAMTADKVTVFIGKFSASAGSAKLTLQAGGASESFTLTRGNR